MTQVVRLPHELSASHLLTAVEHFLLVHPILFQIVSNYTIVVVRREPAHERAVCEIRVVSVLNLEVFVVVVTQNLHLINYLDTKHRTVEAHDLVSQVFF